MSNEIKQRISSIIDQQAGYLWSLSNEIFNDPEIAFKEFHAAQHITQALQNAGYSVEKGVGGLETAFRAKLGPDHHPTIAILAEYDALVGIGHACGHNLIAASAVGAGLALAPFVQSLHGQIQIIGTPAEEGGGGKIILARNGVFNNIAAAMMFHPAGKNMVLRKSLASCRLKIDFIGKASHAAAAPEEGINALDAMILAFNNINALRATFEPNDRVAGIIIDGGSAVNIIPAHTAAQFSIRSLTAQRRDKIINKVIACAQSAAQAIGCKFIFKIIPGYQEIIPNKVLAGLFKANCEQIGHHIDDPAPNERMGSTDMGDVSHLVPSIHPYLAIAPQNIAGHTLEFKQYCNSESGRSAMLDAAKALAMTAVDLLNNPDLLNKAKQELEIELSAR